VIVLVLRKAKPGLKGFVTRWLSEVGNGAYLGTVSSRVRERLWARITTEIGDGGAIMIYPAQTEQGYAVSSAGKLPYTFEDFEGLILAKKRISK
jgi:CRISPR-associated protein Cas2